MEFLSEESRAVLSFIEDNTFNPIEDITRWREYMNFMFEWQEQYR